jgi:osomolarity two-component system sensor histidine kinase NIK1
MGEILRILLVEDNLLNQRIVLFSLKKYNHEVIIANNGLEAVEKFSESEFDVILMDIMMPVMDGLEATVKIREVETMKQAERRTPIIALTANTMDNDRDKCLSYGMDEFMAKPFDIEKLKTIFNQLEIVS